MVAAITNILKEARSEILTRLKMEGRLTVEAMASALGISKVSIRRHLDILHRDGLVAFDVERQDRGRPGHVYYLTAKAEILFPTGYNRFALDVLKQVRVLFGDPAVSKVFCNQADDLISSFKPKLKGLGFDDRVEKLCTLVNERGYDTFLRKMPDGSYLLKQRNCPMVAVATAYDQICNEEIRFYRELLETEVVRECRIAAGSQSCDYRILPPRKKGSQGVRPLL